MFDIVDGKAPEEINATVWRRLMRTYKNDVSAIDGFTGLQNLCKRPPARDYGFGIAPMDGRAPNN